MTENILRIKSKEYATNVVLLCRTLKQNRVEGILVNQFIRSSTAIGANVAEAEFAQGPRDFVSKLEIALKECNESDYWLELIYSTQGIAEKDFNELHGKCVELRRLLISSVTTVKKKDNFIQN